MNTEKTVDHLVDWLKARTKEAGAKGIIFGLSGGVDSAVMAGLAKKAFPETSLGIIMPCESLDEDEEDARLVADALDLDIDKVDLTNTYKTFIKSINLNEENHLAKSNVKPRLRMMTLYYYAQSLGYLVAGPTNKSEFITGYFTKHADSGVDILPLISFTKKEIYMLAEYLSIPRKIIDKVPSAGLWENQSDEEEMGFTYESIDDYINNREMDSETREKIFFMNKKSEHKRKYPTMFFKS